MTLVLFVLRPFAVALDLSCGCNLVIIKKGIAGYYAYQPATYTSIGVLARLGDRSPIGGNQ